MYFVACGYLWIYKTAYAQDGCRMRFLYKNGMRQSRTYCIKYDKGLGPFPSMDSGVLNKVKDGRMPTSVRHGL